MELNPYIVESASGMHWGYNYSIEIIFDEGENGDELMILVS